MWKLRAKFGVVLLVFLMLVGCSTGETKPPAVAIDIVVDETIDGPVWDWLNAFARRDYEKCDTFVANQDVRLFSPMAITHVGDSRYYMRLLNGLVDSVSGISVVETADGVYRVRVNVVGYEEAVVEVPELDELKARYIDGEITDEELMPELEELYYVAFESSCFQKSDLGVLHEFSLTMYDSEKDGVAYAVGTADLIDLLLTESGLSMNLAVYEHDINVVTDMLLGKVD